MMLGQCKYCGAPSAGSCRMCGASVCASHRVGEVCISCSTGKAGRPPGTTM